MKKKSYKYLNHSAIEFGDIDTKYRDDNLNAISSNLAIPIHSLINISDCSISTKIYVVDIRCDMYMNKLACISVEKK